ncbi:uncharacterized protein LOC100903250 [Galendromus occidentalis]|uniref:Uncharacterized protein LOC100903250 n=1 Tax=Galendromus occidentalis TaxID=34638 RepID=A0AAJ6VW62_9ACAR|nr:uncharacterized protein LOC100903250 [Galendromus occidentalis]
MSDSIRNISSDDAGASEWFLELDDEIRAPLSEPRQQHNSNWDTDSGYEPSPAYFANERRFEYPPIEDVDEEGDDEEDLLDDVFIDSATGFQELPSTPRSYAIPIPARKPSTPSDDIRDQDDFSLVSRPHSCPPRDPEFELDHDDFLDSGEELDTLVEKLQARVSVSTQTDWMFDEELAGLAARSTNPNVPDVVPRRLPRSLPRRAASFNGVDFLTIGYELRRLSDRWEDARRQKRALENPNTFMDFVYNAISTNRDRRRPRIPPTFVR